MFEKFRIIGVALGVLTTPVAWSQAVPAAKERTITVGDKTVLLKSRLKNLLHANFTFDYHHNEGKVAIQKTLEELSASEGWKLTTITNHGEITLAELKNYEVVVFNNISDFDGPTFSNASKLAVQTYVEEGGGSFSVHGSGDGYRSKQWLWYTNVWHPVGFEGHGPRTSGDVFRGRDAAGHPVMEGLLTNGKKLIALSEWYKNHTSIYAFPNSEVLLELDAKNCKGCFEDQYIFPEGNPISWVLNIGKGKNLFFHFGHDHLEKREFNEKDTQNNWNKFFNQGLYYVAGYDTIPTVSLPGYRSSSVNGMDFHPAIPSVVFNQPGKFIVKLADVNGKVLQSKSLVGPTGYIQDVSGLRKGVYFLQASGNGKSHTQRYLIQ
jgi:hypothetical protein